MLVEVETVGFGQQVNRDVYELTTIKTGQVEVKNTTVGTYLGVFNNPEKFYDFIRVEMRGKILATAD